MFRELTILHSNDLHGDFFSKEGAEGLIGGVSMLSGYIQQVRREEKNVLYVISGDMLQGSIIDQEYQGISTIDIMNLLGPDMVTLGNHEIDYGLAHLMFLERCAKFPIINANLHIRPIGTRLFESHRILMVGGIRILFIGIITEEILHYGNKDPLLGTFVDVAEAAREVEYICNNYKDVDIDFTILLTHIGIEKDKELAALLPEEIGVDLIIGGHSHTMLDEPEQVKDILIVQVGDGSHHVGRFDVVIDMEKNAVHDYRWQVIPIDESHCPRDRVIDEVLGAYESKVKEKYSRILSRLDKPLEHGDRYRETELGNLFSDLFKRQLGVDFFLLGSGSIRGTGLEEVVTLSDLREIFPYDEQLMSFSVSGNRLKEMFLHFLDRLYKGHTREFYQVSHGLVLDVLGEGEALALTLFDEEPDDERIFRFAMQKFHFDLLEPNFGINRSELENYGAVRCVSTSSFDILEEYFSTHPHLDAQREGRITLEIKIED